MVALKRAIGFLYTTNLWRLSTFPTDAACKLDVLWHDGDTLGVDGAQVGVLKKTDQVSFAGLLKSHDGRALESEFSLEVLGDFSDQALEWELTDEKLGALLVTTDFTESDGSWPVTMGFLDTSGSGGTLPCCLGGKLLARSLSSS